MRSRRRTHHSHVAWSGSDEEFQAQTPQPAWDAAWGRVRAERKQAGLPNTYGPGVLGRAAAGATSNAVERGNRRYRKMQKTVYRVRTQRAIEGRLALDLLREQHAQGRAQTTKILHKARAA